MKTGILYCSTHGTTARIARMIADKIIGEISIIDLAANPQPDITGFGRIIIGGSIHAGAIQKPVQEFCKNNMELLLQKELGLFICCMNIDHEKEELEKAYPQKLRANSLALGCFGGELLFDKMNFFEKLIARIVSKTSKSVSKINYEAIDAFVKQMKGRAAA